MRLRSSLLLIALAFLIGCSGGGSAAGGTAAPPAGPQSGLIPIQLKVDVGSQAREIQASERLPLTQVIAEVVALNSSPTPTPTPTPTSSPAVEGSLSGFPVVATGFADVAPDDRQVTILLEVPPGTYDIYIFGRDGSGSQPVANGRLQNVTLIAGQPQRLQTSVSFNNGFVTVTPNPAVIAVGGAQQFSAVAFLRDGTTNQNVAWTSSDPAIATIDTTGRAVGVSPGNVTITATSLSDSSLTPGTASLTVNPAAVTNVILNFSQNPPTVNVGQAGLQFTTDADFSDNTSQQNVVGATYTSTNPGVLTVDATTGAATAVAPGTADVTSSFGGVTSQIITVTVNAVNVPRMVALQSSPNILTSYNLNTTDGSLSAVVDTENLAVTPGSFLGSGESGPGNPDTVFFDTVAPAVHTFTVDNAADIVARNVLGTLGAVRALEGNGLFFYTGSDTGANDILEAFQFDPAMNLFTNQGNALSNLDFITSIGVSALQVIYYTAITPREAHSMSLSGNVPTGTIIGVGHFPPNPAIPHEIKSVPGANFVLVGSNNTGGGVLEAVAIDPTTGALGAATGTAGIFLDSVTRLVVHPSGRFAFVLSASGGNTRIDTYTVTPTGNGSDLAQVSFFSFAPAQQVFDLDIDPTGNFLYATNFGTGSVARFQIDQSTGALSAPTDVLSLPNVFQIQILN